MIVNPGIVGIDFLVDALMNRSKVRNRISGADNNSLHSAYFNFRTSIHETLNLSGLFTNDCAIRGGLE